MGTRMMVGMAQATSAIAEDALAGVSLLLPAPHCAQCQLPVPSRTSLGSPAKAAAASRGWGGSRSRQGP